MREISEATQAILKGQNLIAQDKYNHQLMLEGTDYYSDITNTLVNKVKTGAYNADYAVRSDGKILLIYGLGTGLYSAIIDNEQDMMSVIDIAGTGTLLMSFNRQVGNDNFKLLKLKNGKIMLIVSDLGIYGSSDATIKVYMSESGLGDDFTLICTPFTFSLVGTTYLDNASVGRPCQTSDGKIIFTAMTTKNVTGQNWHNVSAFVSSDGGVTWARTAKEPTGNRGGYRSGKCGNTVAITDSFILATYRTQGLISYWIDFLYSLNGGATWQQYEGAVINYINAEYQTIMDFYVGIDGWLYVMEGTTTGVVLSKLKIIDSTNVGYVLNSANWTLMQTNTPSSDGSLSISPRGTIHWIYGINNESVYDTYDMGMLRDVYSEALSAASISISKGRGGANSASIQASNKDGALNPKNSDSPLYGILGTNKQMIIKQGYGTDLIETFTGMIDGFDMATWPQTTNISLRDNLKKALDQTVTYGTQHTIAFTLQPIENIVGYLCYLAGIETGTIEATGIQVAKTFSWESYADCFQFLGDLASFEWGCDEYGKFYFRRDYQPDNMYVAYTFEEGVDIQSLRYTIKDDDLYYKVAVFGKAPDGTVISYEAPFLDTVFYNLMPQKILKIDATEATTIAELRKIAERAIALMQSRTAVVNFTSIGVPWLQVGDFIGVYERSTGAANIYRISSLKLDMDSDSFTMSIDAYYYGDSIVPGELPTESGTQTVAPATNIIPEMTSNTAPSGVARASSVYTSAYEPWQAFNSTEADLYWNAITNTGWIEYQFPEKMIVDKYSLKARQSLDYNDAMPKTWTFEGFDGATWVVLDTRTAQTTWGVSEVRTFLFANTVAYSKYRLNVTANNGYNRLQLEQLAMYYGGGS